MAISSTTVTPSPALSLSLLFLPLLVAALTELRRRHSLSRNVVDVVVLAISFDHLPDLHQIPSLAAIVSLSFFARRCHCGWIYSVAAEVLDLPHSLFSAVALPSTHRCCCHGHSSSPSPPSACSRPWLLLPSPLPSSSTHLHCRASPKNRRPSMFSPSLHRLTATASSFPRHRFHHRPPLLSCLPSLFFSTSDPRGSSSSSATAPSHLHLHSPPPPWLVLGLHLFSSSTDHISPWPPLHLCHCTVDGNATAIGRRLRSLSSLLLLHPR